MKMKMAMKIATKFQRSRFVSLFSTDSSKLSFPAENSYTRVMANPSTKLFISGLSKRTTDKVLREGFEKFGKVVHAEVERENVSGRSKGFGFVRYATLEGAAAGVEGMDGGILDGWVMFAEYVAEPSANEIKTGSQ